MTSAVDNWSQDEVLAGPSVSLPTIVSSSDLFDGELFGDELIDIYNSTLEGHPHDDVGIPLLDLIHDKSRIDNDEDHPGARVAVAAAAMDDGLGAFRPSTSFNDLTTLLQPAAAAAAEPISAGAGAAAAVGKSKATTTTNKKRSGSESSSSGTKRKAAASTAGGRRASQKKPKATKCVAAAKAANTVAAATASAVAAAAEVAQVTIPDHATVAAAAAAAAVTITAPSPSPDSIVQGLATLPVTPDGTHTMNITTTATALVSAAPTPEAVTSHDSSVAAAAAVTTAPTELIHTATCALPATKAADAAIASYAVAASTATTTTGSGKNNLRIDTSTAHIKALTGNNWVAACSDDPVPPPTTSSSSISVADSTASDADAMASGGCDSKANNRARRQNLTPDERARQNRDRNREHARNTRLRKKAYVEELKRTLTELVAQRDKADLEKRQSAQRELEQREVRFRVIEEFLKLRGRNEVNFSRWAAILEDGFSLVVPVCDFYVMQQPPVASFEQRLDGVSNVMADASNFSVFLQSLRAAGSETAVTFAYQCDRKNFFMDGCNAVLEWTATSLGAAGNQELALKGIIRGKFSPASNKLISSSMSFDTGIVSTQLRMRASAAVAAVQPVEAQQETADAEAAAQADAILDSLEMPHVDVLVPSSIVSVMLQPASVSDSCSSMGESIASNDKDAGMSSDESMSAEA